MRLELIETRTLGFIHYIIRVTETTKDATSNALVDWIARITSGREVMWRVHPQVEKGNTPFMGGDYLFEGRARFSLKVSDAA